MFNIIAFNNETGWYGFSSSEFRLERDERLIPDVRLLKYSVTKLEQTDFTVFQKKTEQLQMIVSELIVDGVCIWGGNR
jgi:hypothetical protein